MAEVNNFDVLKRMAEQNKDIALCPDVTNMTAKNKGKGPTVISVGVTGNPIADIFNNRKRAVLLIFDKQQFDAIKAEMDES